MKRIKGFIKRNIKLFIGIIVGGIIFGGGVYAATVAANTVSYSNTSSGIAATNVQGAIDALYTKANSLADVYKKACRREAFSGSVKFGTATYEFSADDSANLCVALVMSGVTAGTTCKGIPETSLDNCINTAISACTVQGDPARISVLNECCSEKCGSTTNSCYTTCSS